MSQTVLIGLDGATFSILDHLMENGTMPSLRKLVRNGVRAELQSTANPLTPPAWIALMTGRTPGNHGVFDFIWSAERQNDVYFTLYNFRDIQCETIWSIVSRHGRRACSLNFPMMSPPPKISGFVVPGIVSWKHLRRNVHPAGFYEKLKEMPGFDAKEFAWDFEMEKKAERGVPSEEYENWVRFHIRRERHWFDILQYIMKKEPCDLTAINFDGTDKLLHIGWRFLHPETFPKNPSPQDQRMRDICLEYFRELDGFIGAVVAQAGPDARIIMASDHGFGPSWQVFRVNSWLHSKGYLAWKDVDHSDEKTRKSVEKLVDQHFVYLDWSRTTAYARSTTSNGIYIRVAKNGGSGVPIGQYEEFRRNLIAELKAIRDPESGEGVIKEVLTREEAYPGRHNEQAPDLTLVMRDHSFVSILNKMPVVQRRPEIVGTHYPQGIFIAHGPGFKRGETLAPLHIEDITPCLLYSMGLDIPSDLDGRMPETAFDSTYLANHPCRIGEATKPVDSYARHADTVALEPDEREKILDKLRALGYVE